LRPRGATADNQRCNQLAQPPPGGTGRSVAGRSSRLSRSSDRRIQSLHRIKALSCGSRRGSHRGNGGERARGGDPRQGRDEAPASVDQPKVTQGGWVRPGEAVVEGSFADALGIHAGDWFTLNGRSFKVAGVAVTAALPPYPEICHLTCNLALPQLTSSNTGLMWLTRADARILATPVEPLSYLLNLKLADPARAGSFASVHNVNSPTAPFSLSWQAISQVDALLVKNEQRAACFPAARPSCRVRSRVAARRHGGWWPQPVAQRLQLGAGGPVGPGLLLAAAGRGIAGHPDGCLNPGLGNVQAGDPVGEQRLVLHVLHRW
jgi:hypothetical protein